MKNFGCSKFWISKMFFCSNFVKLLIHRSYSILLRKIKVQFNGFILQTKTYLINCCIGVSFKWMGYGVIGKNIWFEDASVSSHSPWTSVYLSSSKHSWPNDFVKIRVADRSIFVRSDPISLSVHQVRSDSLTRPSGLVWYTPFCSSKVLAGNLTSFITHLLSF